MIINPLYDVIYVNPPIKSVYTLSLSNLTGKII